MLWKSQQLKIKPPKKSIQVAYQILWMAHQQNKVLTPLQLQKLVFISHGWMLAIFDLELFREPIKAGIHGPIELKVYKKFKKFGCNHIDRSFKNLSHCFDKDELDVLSQVIAIYGDYNGFQLSNITHKTGTPWSTTISMFGSNAIIPNDLIKQYYYDLSKPAEEEKEKKESTR